MACTARSLRLAKRKMGVVTCRSGASCPTNSGLPSFANTTSMAHCDAKYTTLPARVHARLRGNDSPARSSGATDGRARVVAGGHGNLKVNKAHAE